MNSNFCHEIFGQVNRRMTLVAVVLVLGACATTPVPQLTDFDPDRAEVSVRYTEVFGILSPEATMAQELAEPVAREHCDTMEKSTTYVSLRTLPLNATTGDYVILYRCEGADIIRIE